MSMVRSVVGGVDTHADQHVAAAIDHNGGVIGTESFSATEAGFEALLGWLVSHGEVEMVGVEGTGSWGVDHGSESSLKTVPPVTVETGDLVTLLLDQPRDV